MLDPTRHHREAEERSLCTSTLAGTSPWLLMTTRRADLLRWAEFNRDTLREHHLYATGTTGTILKLELGLPINRFLSGPVGGDQQIGARITQGQIDVLIFFWDPLEAQPHDTDVKGTPAPRHALENYLRY
jgi:hypothetical protein